MLLKDLLMEGYGILKKASIDSYQIDTQLLLGKILNKDRLFILTNPDYHIEEEERKKYFQLIDLRKNKMPIKYILGTTEFMGLDFNIKEGVLIPRPDTEILVETVFEEIKNKNYKKVCDVCCGSGIIGITIGHALNNTEIICYDIEDIPCNITKENILKHNLQDRVEVIKSDLLTEAIKEKRKFDVIVSNPPYIREEVIETLMDDVKKYEPFEALCGGSDGLFFYKGIIKQSLEVLNNGGTIAFEIGHDQKMQVSHILHEYGFKDILCIKDLAGNDRVIKARRC
ncbi:peptide chain release factor N(5)-glutamine methyltransferase [Clostridium sporogenes]|uniref:peptide chain release factor N(5)-glutamine methyltransferase n=1 Tax=Clostridium TaxID=1485 RepID=UPI0006AB9F95|nr:MULTISPECIES: peptide chain release factor N(5)-glutamine methyltransferase [Clostridium]KOR26267.1 N5-glutamine S-adenosyl-L-methionine-dependent methyltransferase [Clostridium sp. L74]NFV14403.1 peptide chain release factor N(5)-glutamine methyltransferase [Clostridium sporogenes]